VHQLDLGPTAEFEAELYRREEVRRAAYAAPSAIFIAVIGTGIIGWLLNIVLVLCSGPLYVCSPFFEGIGY
jgi:hypothetical protein